MRDAGGYAHEGDEIGVAGLAGEEGSCGDGEHGGGEAAGDQEDVELRGVVEGVLRYSLDSEYYGEVIVW